MLKRINNPLAIGGLAGLAVAVLGPPLTVGMLPFGDLALLGAFWIAVPLSIFSGIACTIPLARVQVVGLAGFSVALFFATLLFGLPLADMLKLNHCREARDFCRRLIPLLEEYKATHGMYPQTIAEVVRPGTSRPLYLRRQHFYASKGDDFTFAWQDSPGVPICSGVASYHHSSTNWDFCGDWGGVGK